MVFMLAPILNFFGDAGGKIVLLFPVFAAVYLIIFKIRAVRGGKALTFAAVLPGLVLLLYLAAMLAVLIVPNIHWSFSPAKGLKVWLTYADWYALNLVPFKTLREQFAMLQADGLHSFDGLKMVLNLSANLFIFLPLPLLLRWNFKKIRWWQSLAAVFCSSLLIELIQYPLHRSSDVDDVLVNTLGGLLGCALCAVAVRAVQKRRAQKKAAPKQAAK